MCDNETKLPAVTLPIVPIGLSYLPKLTDWRVRKINILAVQILRVGEHVGTMWGPFVLSTRILARTIFGQFQTISDSLLQI